MDDPLDVKLQDPVFDEEIRMVTHLIVVASQTAGPLDQEAVDMALGLDPQPRLPHQRRPRP